MLIKLILIPVTLLAFISCSEIIAPEDITPPQIPANFTLLGGGDGQVRLRWSSNTEVDFGNYRIYRSVNNTLNFVKLVDLLQTEYLDRFLEYDSTYYYYLTALDKAGNESLPTSIIDVQPLNIAAPQPPTYLIAQGNNNPLQSTIGIRLTWTPPDIGDLLRYRIYRSNDSDFVANSTTFIDSTIIATYFDQNIPLNTKYFYKIIAVDKGLKVSMASKSSGDLILSSAELVSPANQTRFSDPKVFDWDPVAGAVSYTVYVGRGPFSDIIWTSDKTSDSEISYAGPDLVSTQVYYWWVGAYSRKNIYLENNLKVPAQVNSYSSVNSFFSE
jgi:fibronectin type 3 domain-containing protein